MSLETNAYKVLQEISNNQISTSVLKERFPNSSIDILKNLERIGLIKRNNGSDKISLCKWEITLEGKAFLRFKEKSDNEIEKFYKIVMTFPPHLLENILKKHPNISLTEDAIQDMFKRAENKVRILSPYVDASIINYLKSIKNHIKIEFVTAPTPYGKNTVLERLKQVKPNLEVKYLFERKGDIQQFQTHAKIIIIDISEIYIGSANFKDTSMLYNLEGGIVLTNSDIIKEYIAIFDDIYISLQG